MTVRPRILVAGDRPISLRGLTLILEHAQYPNPIARTASTNELLDVLRGHKIDLVLISLATGTAGIEILRAIRKAFPHVPALVLHDDGEELAPMPILRAGAAGYVHSDASTEELLAAVEAVLKGKTYLSTVVAETIARALATGRGGYEAHEKLSQREQQVFRLLGSGKRVTEIARELDLSVKTVSTHRARILSKTHLRNNAEIIRYALVNKIT